MPQALLSVYDKTGLVDFALNLHRLGWRLIASGGTAKDLRDAQIPVTEVADYTGSPEILGGRVKTLHPAIHGGLLARSTESDMAELRGLGWDTIDLVASNLYPFEQTIAKPNVTFEDAIENIDIGGVTLIRAAAKNHERVTLVCDPDDYAAVAAELEAGGVKPETHKRLAAKGFAYDTLRRCDFIFSVSRFCAFYLCLSSPETSLRREPAPSCYSIYVQTGRWSTRWAGLTGQGTVIQ
jgi:phosphoribosylaminoimidazolecarboxamide formyltransferase/IMP cyclohydrolase